VPLLLLLLALPIIVLALMPLILLQRYRVGSARRLARPWAASLTLGAMVFSAVFFLFFAALTALWVPRAFTLAAAGLTVGVGLGAFGLWLTRWEPTPRTLHYTPNRWLVLLVTLVVSARMVYGLWRSWTAIGFGASSAGVVGAFGVAEAVGAGAIVIGYYLAYSAGVRWRIGRWQRRALRGM
jgi:hypothetical protein